MADHQKVGFKKKNDKSKLGRDKNFSHSLRVYARLTNGQYNKVVSGEYCLEIPRGVTMINRAGNKGLIFQCENKDIFDILTEALDESDIVWGT